MREGYQHGGRLLQECLCQGGCRSTILTSLAKGLDDGVESLASVGREGASEGSDLLELRDAKRKQRSWSAIAVEIGNFLCSSLSSPTHLFKDAVDQSLCLSSRLLLSSLSSALDLLQDLFQSCLQSPKYVNRLPNESILALYLFKLARSSLNTRCHTLFISLGEGVRVGLDDREGERGDLLRGSLEGVGPLGFGKGQDLEGLVVEEVKLAVEAAGDGLGELERLGDDILSEVLEAKEVEKKERCY